VRLLQGELPAARRALEESFASFSDSADDAVSRAGR
jgi:hypothetical protein